MQELTNVQFDRMTTFNYFLNPILKTDNLFKGTVGTRRVATFFGVNDGDPLAKFTVPNAVLKRRTTVAELHAGTNKSFGNPISSKTNWSLVPHEFHVEIDSQTVTDLVGLTNQSPANDADRGAAVMDVLINAYGNPINTDLHRHAMWSHTTFDPDTTYASPAHAFEDDTVLSLQENTGFLTLIKAALDAAKFNNYQTAVGGTGLEVDGSELSIANAGALVEKLVSQASSDLTMLNFGDQNIEKKPFGLLSHDLYNKFKYYLADKFKNSNVGYILYAQGEDGSRMLNSEAGLLYDGFVFYNAANLFDDYWKLTNKTGNLYQHMGLFTSRENLSLGLNLKNPADLDNGLSIWTDPNPTKQGQRTLSMFLQLDFLIGNDTLFSTVGFEKLP